jgi:2-desacetyl-2-hydroxyethyl bacteriochlorophyllide A dehydrogenase
MTAPRTIAVIDVDIPEPDEKELLIANLYSGISAGTEMNIYRGIAPFFTKRFDPELRLFVESGGTPDMTYPLIYGYAVVGRVLAVGSAVSTFEPGQLVFSYSPHSSASVVSADSVVALPELADPRVGVLNANLETAYNGVLDAHPNIGDVVVVSGLGVVGMLALMILRRAGVTVYGVDSVPARRALAERYGAVTFSPGPDVAAEIRRRTASRGADIVIEASGASPALNEAIRIVGYNGTVIALSWYGGTFESLNLAGEFHHLRPRIIATQVGGLSPDLGPLWSTARRQEVVSELLGSLDLSPLMTHEFDIEQAAAAYEYVDARPDDLVQCLIRYPLAGEESR